MPEYDGPFTSTGPGDGDVTLVMRSDGEMKIFLPNANPMAIMNGRSPPNLIPNTIRMLALWKLSQDDAVMEAAEHAILEQMAPAIRQGNAG